MSKYYGENLKNILHPSNKEEQIIGSTAFILDNDAHYDSLQIMPRRLEAAALKIVMAGPYGINGYHSFVIRSAMEELEKNGCVALNDPPYETKND